MSDVKGFVVVLEADMREDDAQDVIKAIQMVRGVLSVKPITANFDDLINRDRIRMELHRKVYRVFHDDAGEKK